MCKTQTQLTRFFFSFIFWLLISFQGNVDEQHEFVLSSQSKIDCHVKSSKRRVWTLGKEFVDLGESDNRIEKKITNQRTEVFALKIESYKLDTLFPLLKSSTTEGYWTWRGTETAIAGVGGELPHKRVWLWLKGATETARPAPTAQP